jgi:hypothetical protein
LKPYSRVPCGTFYHNSTLPFLENFLDKAVLPRNGNSQSL